MHRAENEATATAPTPTVKQALTPSAAEVSFPEAAVTEVRTTSDRPDFLLILLRALSAWGT
jgi:hypothetical protein